MSFVRHSVAKVEMVFWLSTTRSTGMGQTGVASSRQRHQLMHDIYRAKRKADALSKVLRASFPIERTSCRELTGALAQLKGLQDNDSS